MNVNDKIKQILINKSISPSYFADEIGVQRSSISHILSGRNRPSFDIIQKIIRRFPDLGYDWIMEEETELPFGQTDTTDTADYAPTSQRGRAGLTTAGTGLPGRPTRPFSATGITGSPVPSVVKPTVATVSESPIQPVLQPAQPGNQATNMQAMADKPDKQVERVLMFYTDGTFREFRPS
jgi:transcriptional regulator with XRE-family HTH domain